jgi:hypothetical protein
MSAQQFVSCGVERDISRDRTGVIEPMLNTSAAINNRAGSFIARNLSPTRVFQRRFSIRHRWIPQHFQTGAAPRLFAKRASTLSKFSGKDSEN